MVQLYRHWEQEGRGWVFGQGNSEAAARQLTLRRPHDRGLCLTCMLGRRRGGCGCLFRRLWYRRLRFGQSLEKWCDGIKVSVNTFDDSIAWVLYLWNRLVLESHLTVAFVHESFHDGDILVRCLVSACVKDSRSGIVDYE